MVALEWGDGDNSSVEDNIEGANIDENYESSSASTSASTETNEREGRIRQAPAYLRDYVTGTEFSDADIEVNMAQITSTDPTTFDEAQKCHKWRLAMDAEMEVIERNQTWKLTDLPAGAKKIGVKWICKFNELREVEKHKARLVAKG